jgi:hypothetical protein
MSPDPLTGLLRSRRLRPSRRALLAALAAVGLATTLPEPPQVYARKKTCKRGKKRCAGRCIPKASCCTDADCADQEQCVAGACVTKGCSTDAECPAGQRCIDGICRGLPCATNAGCAADQVCWAFQCTAAGGPCPSNGDCPSNQVCRDEVCLGGGCASSMSTVGRLRSAPVGSAKVGNPASRPRSVSLARPA